MRCPQCGAAMVGVAKFCPECGARLAPALAPVEVRKTVSVVFCDLTGSTSLGERHDPETLRTVMTRYFSAMSAVLERHAGTVEKYIGDAVMAVFGVPLAHEVQARRSWFWSEALATADDSAGAERILEQAVQLLLLREGGQDGHLATFAPELGQLCYRRGDHAAAANWVDLGRRATVEHDLDAQIRWRALAAKLEAHHGNTDTALRLADEAVELARRGDQIVLQAGCHADRAEVLHLAGRHQDAAAALRQALDCYEHKGHKPGMRWMNQRLEPSSDGVQRTAEHRR